MLNVDRFSEFTFLRKKAAVKTPNTGFAKVANATALYGVGVVAVVGAAIVAT